MYSRSRSRTSMHEDRLYNWTVQKWPALLLKGGLALFWLACIDSVRLPIETIFVGPAMMVAGITMTAYNKHK
jgi:hypothetical protein